MAGLGTVAAWLAGICGVGAVSLLVLSICFYAYLVQQKQKKVAAAASKRAKTEDADKATPVSSTASTKQRPRQQACERDQVTPKLHPAARRDASVLQKEQELKRDTLHILRKLQAAETLELKEEACIEAVNLFDKIEQRVGAGMAAITSGRIVFCNSLMECGGLDDLRDCQEAKLPSAAALIERVVPIIFSS